MFDEAPMREITNFALLGAKEKGEGVVTGGKVRNNVIKKADDARELVKKEIKGKLLSVAADLATCNSVSFLGVMAQYQIDGVIKVINLSCRQVLESHTGENVKGWFQGLQEEYEIDGRQIICVSTDAAANMIRAANDFIKELATNDFSVALASEDDEDDLVVDLDTLHEHYPSGIPFDVDPSSPIEFDDEENEQDDLVDGASANFTTELDTEGIPNAYRINCVVHQLQLAIVKFLKSLMNQKLLAAVRALAAKLRTPSLRNELRKLSL